MASCAAGLPIAVKLPATSFVIEYSLPLPPITSPNRYQVLPASLAFRRIRKAPMVLAVLVIVWSVAVT